MTNPLEAGIRQQNKPNHKQTNQEEFAFHFSLRSKF
jgi:hypothetical protein